MDAAIRIHTHSLLSGGLKFVRLAFVLDRDIILKRAKGVWRHPLDLPVRQIQQRPIRMDAMEVWAQAGRDIESGMFGEDAKVELLGEEKGRSVGLFYFDYCARKNQIEENNLAQSSGFSTRYCRELEVRPGLCLWSLELLHANAPQTIGRNHGYIDAELKPPQRVQRLTILLTNFETVLE